MTAAIIELPVLGELLCNGEVGKASADKPYDPGLVASISATATSRHAHHEAGHAVAVIVRCGILLEVSLGTTDWDGDPSADTPGFTRHRTAWEAQPFVTFAGPWAEAMWTIEHHDAVDDFRDALDYAWLNNADGDGAKYDDRVSAFSNVAEQLGFATTWHSWETDWAAELNPLWPVVRRVAQLLIDGQPVTHNIVQSLVADPDLS